MRTFIGSSKMQLAKLLTVLISLFVFESLGFALNVGDKVPTFSLTGADGKSVYTETLGGKIIVLEWTNPGCPYVKKHYKTGHMQKLQSEYAKRGVIWLTINSTNREHSDFIDADERADFVSTNGIHSTSYLFDEDGKVGQKFDAKTTPHLFIIDRDGTLAYQGAIDDTPMGEPDKSKNYVVQGLDELLAGKAVSEPETKSYGCSVKYQ